MSEKRFELQHINDLTDQEYMRLKKITDNGELITLGEVVDLLNEQQSTIEHLRKQIQIYEQLISNSYVGEEETLDGFVGKYVIWENEFQKYKEKIKGVFNE